MGIFDRFKRGNASGKRDMAMYPRWSSPPARNTQEWLQTFGTNPRLAVVDKIATDLAAAPGRLYRIEKDGKETEVTSHPFLDFFLNPNPMFEMTSAAIWRLQGIYLMLKGEGYFLIERDSFNRPKELWPLPTHWVQDTPYMGNPYYRIRTTGGGIFLTPADDVFVMKELNPLDPYRRGLGQAEALADEIEIDEYAAKFQKRFFYNDATPNLVVTMPNSTEDQRRRFRAQWLEKFQGPFKSHGIATINGDAKVEKLADNMKDLDMVNGRTFVRDAVLEHFGMPREIMGITQNSNRATAEAAMFIYAQNVLTPKLKEREEAVNLQLLPVFGADLIWHYDDIVPRNQEFDKAKALEGWNGGLLEKNEARELLDLPAVEEGDVYKVNFADMFVKRGKDLTDTSLTMAELQYGMEPEMKKRQRWEEKGNRLSVAERSIQMVKKEQQAIFEAAARKYFSEQAKRMQSSLLGQKKEQGDIWETIGMDLEEFQKLPQEQRESLIDKFVSNLLNWPQEKVELERLLMPLWKETYGKGAEAAEQLYRISGIQRPELVSTAKMRGGQRITRITQTTKNNIRQLVTAALEQGQGKQELSEAIMDEMNTSAGRARVIAAQECNTSLMQGHFDMARKSGFSMKTWHITNALKARDSHLELNGKTIPIDEPFVTILGNKLMQPCDPNCSDAADVVNCHCFLTYS